MAETTGRTIAEYCRQHNLPHSSVVIPCGGNTPPLTLHEIKVGLDQGPGSPKSGRILLFFPGGGYVIPVYAAGQLPFAIQCAKSTTAESAWILEYTLAPELRYPGQMVQAAAALKYLICERSISPDHIVLGGDSAGGHLALALLAHARHPRHDVHSLGDVLKTPLRAVYLLSPWISLGCSTESFKAHSDKDYVFPGAVQRFLEAWRPSPSEPWAEMLRETTPDFWRDLPVRRLLITAGTLEVFRDDIISFSENLRAGNSAVTFLLVENEIHVQSAIDTAMRLPCIGSGRATLDWLENV